MFDYFVYIMTNKPKGTLYVGVTDNLARRVHEHKNNITKGFTSKYKLHKLVFYSHSTDINAAIEYEKRVKKVLKLTPFGERIRSQLCANCACLAEMTS